MLSPSLKGWRDNMLNLDSKKNNGCEFKKLMNDIYSVFDVERILSGNIISRKRHFNAINDLLREAK